MLPGYTLIRRIGQGGFGEVILAKEDLSNREVAIKCLKKKDIHKPEEIIHEINVISKFYHPGIVIYHHAGIVGDSIFLVMEYCPKGSLREKLYRNRIPFEESLQLMLEIASTLRFIHEKGIIHHDIKPANLLISDTGKIKIADFGVANSRGGTQAYMPPIYSDNRDFRTNMSLDIYALGITFIEMVNGKHPLADLPIDEIITNLQKKNLGIDHLPLWIQEIIYKCVSLDQNIRFQSANELIHAIETKNIPVTIDSNSIKAGIIAKKNRKKFKMEKILYSIL